MFDVKPSSPQHQFYIDFVESISSTNYKNLGELERFANVSEFNKVDLLMIAREMKKNVPLAGNYFTHVITEVHNQIKIERLSDELVQIIFLTDGNVPELNKVLQASESILSGVRKLKHFSSYFSYEKIIYSTFKNISPEVELGTCKSTEVCRTSVTPTNFDNTSINKVVSLDCLATVYSILCYLGIGACPYITYTILELLKGGVWILEKDYRGKKVF